MHTNQPYHRPLFDQILRKELAKNENIKFENVSYAFRNVAVVGMLLPDLNHSSKNDHVIHCRNDRSAFLEVGMIEPAKLFSDDLVMLKRAASIFSESGIPLHPEVSFHIYNLLPPVGSDFLLHASDWHDVELPKADLVSINYIIKHGATRDMWRDYCTNEGFPELTYAQMCEIGGNGKLISVSDMHRQPNIWPTASFNAGAKFVVTHGGTQDEITTNQFKNHAQSHVLICSEQEEKIERKKRTYRGHTMGVVANKDFLSEYAPHIYKKPAVGQAIHRALRA